MGSAIENSAANVAAPLTGKIRSSGLDTSTPLSDNVMEFLGGATSGVAAADRGAVWISFYCATSWYATFGPSAAAITTPDPAATSGDARCGEFPGGVRVDLRILPGTAYFKALSSTGTPTLRWWPSQNQH